MPGSWRKKEALVDALSLLDVDLELMSDHDFRSLTALNFEASNERQSAS